ncbi:hypothetical protein PpBr36_04099 [Pyricularia pennisetigena]|uniref:hypothetical protein n=1 Tax=Pyricularia pennisetigena TaxID=1578925 RepID=UPI00114D7F72|nr:hypothetical protein PpBr36_04099 [Pyricularia pennisetigena]TLS26262.1 hypothetical protein PpBr36_04099 [Pyricularia pennisetigena]
MRSFTVASVLFGGLMATSPVYGQQCKLQFDGRVPANFKPENFDSVNNIFDPKNVLGKGLKFSDLIELPALQQQSIFDVGGKTQALEVTINDKSIFVPNADTVQNGFRRAELLIASNSGTDDSTKGVKTLHFSVAKDAKRPLNLTHEYQIVFLEDNKFSTNQIVVKTGTIAGQANANPDTLNVFGNVASSPPKLLFSTPFGADGFHNFAMTLDFNKNTTQVFFSKGNEPLKAVSKAEANDVSGGGQFHFGILKKGVGNAKDVVREGIQEANINEGLIYGGIFMEDSAGGCISLSAGAGNGTNAAGAAAPATAKKAGKAAKAKQ